MEDVIVKYEAAKLLKEIGFNFYQPTQYSEGSNPTTTYNYTKNQCKLFGDVYYAPTQALAQKYLRENHNIDITIHRSFSMSKSYHYYIIIDGNYEVDEDNIQECTPNRSYEQALEDALVKALTLIKNKIV